MKPKRGKPAASVSRRSYRAMALPVAILLGAFVFRVVSLNSFPTLWDEYITRDVVTGIWQGELSNNWKYTVNSKDYRIDMYNFSSYMYVDGLLAGVTSGLSAPLPDGNPNYVLWSRVWSAVMGTLAVYLFYLVARRLFGTVTATLTMVLLAVMPLLVQDAHYARPEAFVLLLTGAAYYFLLRFDAQRDRLRYLVFASFLFGLLIACKVSLVPMALLPVLFLAQVKDRGFWLRAGAVCGGCTLLGCFVGMPDAFFHPREFWHGVEFLRAQYAQGTLPHVELGSNSVRLTLHYFWQTTGLLLVFALAGALLLARNKRFLLLCAVGAPVAFYLVYFSLQRAFFERNLSHVAPLIAMLAAVALTAMAEMAPAKARATVLVGLLAIAAVPAIRVSSTLVFEAMRTDTEIRGMQYQLGILRTVRDRIDYVQGLTSEAQLNAMLQLAADPKGDYLIRLVDFHDDFTRKNLQELKRRTNWIEVGYFPSLFEGMDVNTLIAYHSWSYRYMFLAGPRHTQ